MSSTYTIQVTDDTARRSKTAARNLKVPLSTVTGFFSRVLADSLEGLVRVECRCPAGPEVPSANLVELELDAASYELLSPLAGALGLPVGTLYDWAAARDGGLLNRVATLRPLTPAGWAGLQGPLARQAAVVKQPVPTSSTAGKPQGGKPQTAQHP